MASRLELHDELRKLLGTNEVHFQPPESKKLTYPCFIYSRASDSVLRADNLAYHQTRRYALTYLTKDPDDPLISEVVAHFKMCTFSASNRKDYLNMYHYDLYY